MAKPKTQEIICLECGHGNELDMVQDENGEWYSESLENCESCRKPLSYYDGPSEASLQRSERQQMGITS